MTDDSHPVPDKIEKRVILPRTQQILLVVFLIIYPLFQWLMNYISPPDAAQIESRILQLYLPSLVLQILILASIMLALIKDGEHISSLGLKPGDISLLNFAIGIAFLAVAVIILNVLSRALAYLGMITTADISYILPKTIFERIFWILLAVSAGISEEICFRGYVITRMARLTGSVWPGVILGSLAFGASHSYQGLGGVIIIGVYGMMFSLLFLGRGSLVPCIIAHALQDIVASFGM
jgi:membrane protease YdiL (CAAX protease family)